MSYKQFIIIAGAIMSTIALNAQNPDWAKLGRYAEANKQLIATAPVSEGRVVLIGNSITDCWPGNHKEFFTENGLIGRGISGQTSYQFIVRFREDVVALRPEIVVINVATNDIAENTGPYDQSRTLGNIKSMVEIARANGIKVILTSVLPTDRFGWRPEIEDVVGKISSLNNAIRDYAQSEGMPYVDYYSAMVDSSTGAMKDGLSGDGVHPNKEGYAIMEEILLPVIERLRK
jgi:lysophospholipase L1-like esterase